MPRTIYFQVVSFCHGDSRDQVNLHNHEAPNEHNRLCAQKSVWQVMLESEDFASNNNPPNPGITNINPTFKVVSPETPRFVLVLDTSGSMGSGVRFDFNRFFPLQLNHFTCFCYCTLFRDNRCGSSSR